MKRLTINQSVGCLLLYNPVPGTTPYSPDFINRLGEFEETGLNPIEVAILKDNVISGRPPRLGISGNNGFRMTIKDPATNSFGYRKDLGANIFLQNLGIYEDSNLEPKEIIRLLSSSPAPAGKAEINSEFLKPLPGNDDSLEECPFCGSDEVGYEKYQTPVGKRWRCICCECGAMIDPGYAQDRHTVREMWNRRAQPKKAKLPSLAELQQDKDSLPALCSALMVYLVHSNAASDKVPETTPSKPVKPVNPPISESDLLEMNEMDLWVKFRDPQNPEKILIDKAIVHTTDFHKRGAYCRTMHGICLWINENYLGKNWNAYYYRPEDTDASDLIPYASNNPLSEKELLDAKGQEIWIIWKDFRDVTSKPHIEKAVMCDEYSYRTRNGTYFFLCDIGLLWNGYRSVPDESEANLLTGPFTKTDPLFSQDCTVERWTIPIEEVLQFNKGYFAGECTQPDGRKITTRIHVLTKDPELGTRIFLTNSGMRLSIDDYGRLWRGYTNEKPTKVSKGNHRKEFQSPIALSKEELKEMDWEEVWVQWKSGKDFSIVHTEKAVVDAKIGGCMTSLTSTYLGFDSLGETWAAYSEKPQT